MEFRKPIHAELINWIQNGVLNLAPAAIQLMGVSRPSQHSNIERSTAYNGDGHSEIVGSLEADWNDKRALFAFKYKLSNTPKAIESAVLLAQVAASKLNDHLPLVIVPYLSEYALQALEKEEVSGLDLCGNGLLLAPDFRIWRSGAPNRFKDTRPIRNPYGGDSSIFAKCFLLQGEFSSLGQLMAFARERTFGVVLPEETALSLGTASKVVKAMEEEIVVTSQGTGIRLIDPRRLLELLRNGAREPVRPSIVGRTPFNPQEVWHRLAKARTETSLRSVVTGISSAERYGVLSGIEKLSLYSDDADLAAEILEMKAARAFANIEIFAARTNAIYFDARKEGDISWASPIQTWLELEMAGPREREAAMTLKKLLRDGKADKLP